MVAFSLSYSGFVSGPSPNLLERMLRVIIPGTFDTKIDVSALCTSVQVASTPIDWLELDFSGNSIYYKEIGNILKIRLMFSAGTSPIGQTNTPFLILHQLHLRLSILLSQTLEFHIASRIPRRTVLRDRAASVRHGRQQIFPSVHSCLIRLKQSASSRSSNI